MSLIHRWTFNNTLQDQGINPFNIISKDTSFIKGKLGQALNITQDGQYIKINNLNELIQLKQYTLSCWIKLNSQATGHSSSFLSSGDWNSSTAQNCFAAYNFSNGGYQKLLVPNNKGWGSGIELDNPILLNKWYNIIITYDGEYTRGYINGIHQVHEFPGGGFRATNVSYYYLGAATYYNGFTMHGQMNDFRIYDECLNQFDIKEIAKGLCAYYPLNNTFIKSTKNYCNTNQLVKTSNVELGIDNIGHYFIRNDSASTYNGILIPQIPLSNGAGKWFTISYDLMCPTSNFNNNCDTNDYADNYSGNDAVREECIMSDNFYGQVLKGQWTHFEVKIKYHSDAQNLKAGFVIWTSLNNHKIYYKNFQLEEGQYSTTYTSSIRNGNCLDCSGMNNHATVIHNPELNYAPQDKTLSFHCKGNNYIITPKCLKIETEFTMNIWGYMDNWSNYTRLISCTETGGWNIEPYPNNTLSFAAYDSGNGYVNAFSNKPMSELHSGWHMFTIKFDTNNLKGYLDGNLIATSNNYTSHKIGYNVNNSIFIGAEAENSDSTTNAEKFYGYLKDFKMYATALSDQDIKQLYNVKKYITRNSQIKIHKYNENNNITISQLTKEGTQNNNTISEYKILDDGSIWMQILYHNNLDAKNLFNSSDNFENQFVFHNQNCWSNFPILKRYGLYNNNYEFLVIQQHSDGSWKDYRWKQTANPLTATYADVDKAKVTWIKNQPSNYGGIYKGSNAFLQFNNNYEGNWWGSLGCWSPYEPGIPGIGQHTFIQSMYVRIGQENMKVREYKGGITYTSNLVEV